MVLRTPTFTPAGILVVSRGHIPVEQNGNKMVVSSLSTINDSCNLCCRGLYIVLFVAWELWIFPSDAVLLQGFPPNSLLIHLPGSYRFVNEATNLSLSASLTDADTISPLGSTTSRPLDGKSSDFTKVTQTHSNTALDSSMVAHSKTQVWDIVPRVAKNQLSGLPGMFFDVTNNGVPKIKIQPQPDATHSVASPQSSPGWGLLLLTCADTSRESARRYLIHDAQVDGFLGIPTSTGVRSVDTCLGPWKRFAHEKLGEKADTYLGNEWFNGSELLRSMALLNQDEFLENYAHLVWALYEDDLGPADGIYTFSSPSPDQKTFTFLDIPLTQYLEPALLALMPAESRVTGSQWWRITSIMDEKTAEYTYTVVNYRSGHYLEMIDSATAKTKESPEPNIRGTRVVDPKGHSWRFLKTEGGSFQVWNKDNDLCFLWGDHPQAGTATPTCWVITQIFPSFLFGGNYFFYERHWLLELLTSLPRNISYYQCSKWLRPLDGP